MQRRYKRENMSDFDRFKLMIARKQVHDSRLSCVLSGSFLCTCTHTHARPRPEPVLNAMWWGTNRVFARDTAIRAFWNVSPQRAQRWQMKRAFRGGTDDLIFATLGDHTNLLCSVLIDLSQLEQILQSLVCRYTNKCPTSQYLCVCIPINWQIVVAERMSVDGVGAVVWGRVCVWVVGVEGGKRDSSSWATDCTVGAKRVWMEWVWGGVVCVGVEGVCGWRGERGKHDSSSWATDCTVWARYVSLICSHDTVNGLRLWIYSCVVLVLTNASSFTFVSFSLCFHSAPRLSTRSSRPSKRKPANQPSLFSSKPRRIRPLCVSQAWHDVATTHTLDWPQGIELSLTLHSFFGLIYKRCTYVVVVVSFDTDQFSHAVV